MISDFNGLSWRRRSSWGAPDSDLNRVYALEEVDVFSGERVHYGVMRRPELGGEHAKELRVEGVGA
jgi:hypothetical protein